MHTTLQSLLTELSEVGKPQLPLTGCAVHLNAWLTSSPANLSALQSLLTELSEVGKRHGVSIADVACRWVLDRPQVRAFAPLGRRFPTGLFLLCQAAGCWIGHRSVPATVHDHYAPFDILTSTLTGGGRGHRRSSAFPPASPYGNTTASPLALTLATFYPHPQVAGVIIGARNASHVGDLEKVFSFEMDDGAPVLSAVRVATRLGGRPVAVSDVGTRVE